MDKGLQIIGGPLPAVASPPTAGSGGLTAEGRTVFFDYNLPGHLIAQEPSAERDQARLLMLRRADATLAHHVFHELPELLNPGDLLILNDTKVVPARIRELQTNGKRKPDLFWL